MHGYNAAVMAIGAIDVVVVRALRSRDNLCWLILSTTGHHLDPTVVNTSTSTGVSRFFLTYFVCLFVCLFLQRMFLLFSLTLIIRSFLCDLLCWLVWGEHKNGDAHDSPKAKGLTY